MRTWIRTKARNASIWLLCFSLLGASFARADENKPKTAPTSLTASEAHDGFTFPTNGIKAPDKAIVLAIDDDLLPMRRNVCLYLTKPTVRSEAVLTPSRNDPNAPDRLAAHFYGSVIEDGGKFRMWYYGVSSVVPLQIGPVCYAESVDGLKWTKPDLGQYEINGSKHNNAISLPVSNKYMEGVHVIKDDDDPNPARRYKMVYNLYLADKRGPEPEFFSIRTATSADGIHWTAGTLTHPTQFIEQSGFYKHNGYYIINGHGVGWGEGGQGRGRQAYVWISPDFDHWVQEPAESFLLPEPVSTETAVRPAWTKKFDQVHLGVGATSLGNVCVGLYGLWHERGWGEGGTTCDLGLVVSNDGFRFREPIKGHIFLGHDQAPPPPIPGKEYPSILAQSGGGILNVGDETRVYHGRWRNTEDGNNDDYYGDVGLVTFPRDRWGAVGVAPNRTEGSVWSAPITLPQAAAQIALNAESADSMRLEVSDERFQFLPEFSGERSGTCMAQSGLNCPVSWPAGSLKSLAGKTVRLRIHLTGGDLNPRLYAIYLTTEK